VKEYSRKYPEFSLCGLNCILCPRYQTEGSSKCPGCGGKQFYEKHPSCSVITCSQKHNNIEFCFECDEFPCKKFDIPIKQDSFISKKNFMENMNEAKKDITKYVDELKEKEKVLEYLIHNYNDGKMKGYYCLAVNLMSINELKRIIDELHKKEELDLEIKEKAKLAKRIIENNAAVLGIRVELRK
jgi:hypothetical protein